MTFHSEKGMECHHPNWLSLHHFSEGVGIPPTRVDFLLIFPCSPHRIPKAAPGSQFSQCFTEASQRFTWLVKLHPFRPKHWAVTGWIPQDRGRCSSSPWRTLQISTSLYPHNPSPMLDTWRHRGSHGEPEISTEKFGPRNGGAWEAPPQMPRSVGLEKSGFEAYNVRPPATIAFSWCT